MDSNFVEIPPSNALPMFKSPYYLIKMPKDFDLKRLEHITLDRSGCKVEIEDNQKFYQLIVDAKPVPTDAIFRPIINDKTIGAAVVGPAFSGSIQIRQYFPTHADDSAVDKVPQEFGGYGHVEQIADLKVRSMPRGSFTDIKSLWKRSSSRTKRGSETKSSVDDNSKSVDADKDRKKKKKKSENNDEEDILPKSKKSRK